MTTADAYPNKVKATTRQKWVIALLAIGIALDLLISVALYVNAVRTTEASNQARIARVAAYEACLGGNQFRAEDAQRWAAVIALIDTMPDNPDVVRFIQGLEKANGVADKLRDCGPVLP